MISVVLDEAWRYLAARRFMLLELKVKVVELYNNGLFYFILFEAYHDLVSHYYAEDPRYLIEVIQFDQVKEQDVFMLR